MHSLGLLSTAELRCGPACDTPREGRPRVLPSCKRQCHGPEKTGARLDVYEEEADLFFEDLSNSGIRADLFARLLTFPNVRITGHQAFFTREALTRIAETTIAIITAFQVAGRAQYKVSVEVIA